MEEADRISSDPLIKRYNNFAELLAEVEDESMSLRQLDALKGFKAGSKRGYNMTLLQAVVDLLVLANLCQRSTKTMLDRE